MWSEVRGELRTLRGLLPLMASDWWLPYNEMIYEVDASDQGWGIASSFWKRSTAKEVGSTPERSRFKKEAHSARKSALSSAGLVRDGNRWRATTLDEETSMEDWSLNACFEEVPWQLLRAGAWRTVCSGRWCRKEKIMVLEARALTKAMKRLSRTRVGAYVRQVFLSDNMGVVLSFSRCRSRDFDLLGQIRRFCSYCLALNIKACVRWIPS